MAGGASTVATIRPSMMATAIAPHQKKMRDSRIIASTAAIAVRMTGLKRRSAASTIAVQTNIATLSILFDRVDQDHRVANDHAHQRDHAEQCHET